MKDGQAKHDKGVGAWAQHLIQRGWSFVRFDLPGNEKPQQIGQYIPDIYASHMNQEIIIEIETQDSVDLEQSRSQASIFEAWKNQSPSTRRFLIKIV